jgi:hypothetical protein
MRSAAGPATHSVRTTLVFVLLLAGCAAPIPSPPVDGSGVDQEPATFSASTSITNPFFPAASVAQIVHLGVDHGLPLRIEVTLMPTTETIEWNGWRIETVVSQFISYRGGRILEVAYDYFAQADDGSVWYFGEMVDNYVDGVVSNHSGAWRAGDDGPPGMIMPADPQVGDVFHPENIPGLVYETVTIESVSETVDGPRGPIEGALRVEESLMESAREHKIYAPGYGEFRTEAGDERVALALAVPVDALVEQPPQQPELEEQTGVLLAAALSGDWPAARTAADRAAAAWEEMGTDEVPHLLAEQMAAALADLFDALESEDTLGARAAAVDVAQAVLDLQLQYREPVVVDVGRLEMWTHRLLLDAEMGDLGGARGTVSILETIWARAGHAVDGSDGAAITAHLGSLRMAVDESNLGAAIDSGHTFLELLQQLDSGPG